MITTINKDLNIITFYEEEIDKIFDITIFNDGNKPSLKVIDSSTYTFKERMDLIIDDKYESIGNSLVFYDGILYYEDDVSPGDSHEVKKKYNVSFKYDTIFIQFSLTKLPLKYDDLFEIEYTDNGSIIKDEFLIDIINELTENEKQRLIEILKSYNSKWLQKTYKDKNFNNNYELIFKPEF